jgi:hypothetical protein
MTSTRSAHHERRSGITLTEILIAILIMGVGLVSLATLFPLGLLRAQRAMRDSRSTLLAESAISEIGARNLLSYESFYFSTWYNYPNPPNVNGFFFDPWANETRTLPLGNDGLIFIPLGAPIAGMPVCYDPLFWSVVHQNNVATPATGGNGARFGYGQGFIRNDPGDGAAPSAWGLQRITNFRPWLGVADTYPFVYNQPNPNLPPQVPSDTFASPDNIVFVGDDQEFPSQGPGAFSPLVPDLSISGTNSMTFDLMFTWFFTGYRPNANDLTMYTGSVVVCHGRVMGLETITTPVGNNNATVAQGERVLEATWGYSGKQVNPLPAPLAAYGYGRGDRTVLLRWPSTAPDPALRAGGYLADVTYEVNLTQSASRFPSAAIYSGQRCEWYRISGYTTPEVDPVLANYRQTVVTLDAPVRAKTLVNTGTGEPYHANAALYMPSVVNVFQKTFVNRGDQH